MLNNLTLQFRILISFLFMGVLVLIIALLGWFTTYDLNNQIDILANTHIPAIAGIWKINDGQANIRVSEKNLLDPNLTEAERERALNKTKEAWVQIETGFKEYEKTVFLSENEVQKFAELKQSIQKWKQAHEQFLRVEESYHKVGLRNPWKTYLDILQTGKNLNPTEQAKINTALELRRQLDVEGSEKEESLAVLADEAAVTMLNINARYVENSREQAKTSVSRSIFWVSLGIIIGPATAFIFGIFISRQISSGIIHVVKVAEQISEGDLTQKIEVNSDNNRDELNRLLSSFKIMVQNLAILIRQVQQSGIQVNTSTNELAALGKQLEATVTEQVAATNEVAATAREIATTSKQLVKTMEDVATVSQATSASASNSQQELGRLEMTMRQLTEATNSIAAKLGAISEKANNINNVVVTITKVADQTNLLSLNAAIEAEKAGELGLGFAVVAREIRRLADRTAVATLDIEMMVKEMQSSVSTGVMEMDKFSAEVSRSVQDVGNVSGLLGEIIDQVKGLTPQFEAVNEGMEGQSQGAQQISEAMVQLSSASGQTADSIRDINRAISQLNEAAQGLRSEILRFQVGNDNLSDNNEQFLTSKRYATRD